MEKEGKPSELRLEEKRRRIRNLIDDLLNGLKKIENEEEVCSSFIYSKWGVIKPRISYFIWDVIKKLRMNLRFLRTFVLFGNSSFDHNFYEWMSKKINTFSVMTQALFCQVNEVILEKHNMDSLVPLLLEEMESYLRLKNSNYVAMITEEKMFEYLFTNLHDLPNYSSDMFEYLRCRTDYNIFRQVFRRLTDFYPILLANKTTTTQYLFPRFQFIAQTVMQFYFDIWTEKYKLRYGDDACASKITSLLIDIIPLELEVLDISTSNLIKESTSRELKRFVKQIVKSSPRILQNCLIHLQGRMAGAVNYAPTQSINVMIEFLLIFLTDIPKRFIHPDKLNDMLAHVGLLARKISILMEESSENNINEADFTAPDLLQEIERMKGDIKQNFLKAPESSQLRFPMDDGFLFMNLLLRHLNDLLISNAYSVSLIKKEIGMVKESLEFIRSSFKKVRQILDDCTSGVVKDCWLRALDVAYEAEHVINSILVRDKALSHLLFSLPNVTDKIKLIVAEVTCLQLEDKNGDDPLDAKSSDKPIESTSSSFVEVTVGHEEDEAKMIDQLLDKHESELDVISIVGMPGLGKTTLAKKVYNNMLVASHFNVRAWCTVSQKYNKSKVLLEILQQVTGLGGKESEDDLAEKLRVALYDKRYLIVLDDVWDIATGEMLIACFPKVERGNRVILTSRSSEVGLKVKCRSDLLRLQLLTHGKSWELFEKMVFGEGSCPAELLDVGHQIVEKCQGLPLAVVLIAGVIVRGKKKEKDLWLKIQHNLDSFVSANNNLEIMQLSYDRLPYHLKPLLLYFARWRKSKRTQVSKLMQLWMAEGLVDHDIPSKCSLEEATQSYLDALISSNLIMVDHILTNKSNFFSVRIKVCYVHDVVHDFCSVKAKKEKFLKLINPGARFHASDFLHHRLTIHTEEGQLHKKCVLFNSKQCSAGSKHLISLKVSGSLLNSRYVCHTRPFGLVRVLQLNSIVLDDSLMEEIGSLFHLRFLRIHTQDVKAIPVSWLNLQNLETLLINTEYTEYTMVLLPRILKLSKLKHVKIDRSCFFEEEEEEDNIQSRILEGENSKLTTLSHVDISYSEGTNDALKKFPNLQHLQCTIMVPKDPPTHGNWFPKFDVLNKLESIFVEYPWNYYVYPNEYHFPSSLKELRLYWFTMTPALLSAITALPQLEILAIMYSFFVEDKWYAREDFYQSLKTLSLQMVNLSEWEVDRETFPKLEELILVHCEEFMEIPCAFADIETLKSIHLMSMNREIEDSAIEIKKQIIDFSGEDRLQVHLSGVLYELEAEEEDETENAQRTQG
ncbi:putative late blight resistance protein homolog R1A-3 isoform X1 [Solanum stenotomum]|uniref:putative late blight resistance protein homolog R1A-3 isoform X1 n=1 Tax=Solanum stenotomum TaxID=172797 RepID=UPI0020D0365E|nr:putative late blight resistance protein homolog R1A-3 isoform X1 [Solanum stenotomum]